MDAGSYTGRARTYMLRGRMAAPLANSRPYKALHSRRVGRRMESDWAFLYGSGWGTTHFGKSTVTAATCINFFLVVTIPQRRSAGSGRLLEEVLFSFLSVMLLA